MSGRVEECEEERRRGWSRECLVMPGVRQLRVKEYAVPLKVPGQGHLLETMWEEERAKHRAYVGRKQVVQDLRGLEVKAAVVNATTLRAQVARLGRHLQLGMDKAEKDLELKRNKLRKLILEEDTALTHEYVERAQKLSDEIYEQKKKFAEEILMKHEQERERDAKERLEQLARDNSEELKERISIVKKLEAAEIQKHQICEKKIQMEREREFEDFWFELQKKRDEERLKYEEEEEKIRICRIKEQRDVLNKQILGKLMMKDEMQKITEKEAAFIDKLRERIKEEEEKEKEYKLNKKFEQMEIQKAQLEECRKLKEAREREQKEFDDYYVSMLNEAIMKDRMKQMDTRAEVRKEAEFFKKQLSEIKAAQALEEKQIEELRAQEAKKKEEVIRSHQMALKEARERLQRETLETWKLQLAYKQNKLEAERQIDNLVNEWSNNILEKNRALDKLLVNSRRDGDIKTSNDLNLQEKYNALLKERGIDEDNDLTRKIEREDEKKNRLIQSIGTCFGPPHPFTKAILENQ